MPTRFRSYTRVSLLAATLGGAVLLWSASSPGAAAGGQGAAPVAASAGDAAAGRKIFLARSCATCHKADGSGGIKLTGNATPNWRDAKFMSTPAQSDSVLRDCITNGRPKSGMPAWVRTGQVKAEQVPDLIAYIRTFSAKKK